jgi:uncharacterized protein (DUF983 family)
MHQMPCTRRTTSRRPDDIHNRPCVVPLFIWTVHLSRHFGSTAIWLPATVIMCLVLLAFMKGATIGICWATNIVRQDAAT